MYGLGNLGDKVTSFTRRIVRLNAYLQTKNCPLDWMSQVRRSGTSIGANCSEAVYAQSKADYLTKLQIALKEANETAHWLEVLHEGSYIDERGFTSIDKDCREICRILTAIIKRVRNELEYNK